MSEALGATPGTAKQTKIENENIYIKHQCTGHIFIVQLYPQTESGDIASIPRNPVGSL
jgi:hypothetical protein